MPTLLGRKSNFEGFIRKQWWNVSWSWWYYRNSPSFWYAYSLRPTKCLVSKNDYLF